MAQQPTGPCSGPGSFAAIHNTLIFLETLWRGAGGPFMVGVITLNSQMSKPRLRKTEWLIRCHIAVTNIKPVDVLGTAPGIISRCFKNSKVPGLNFARPGAEQGDPGTALLRPVLQTARKALQTRKLMPKSPCNLSKVTHPIRNLHILSYPLEPGG